jgi:hypothetical protein
MFSWFEAIFSASLIAATVRRGNLSPRILEAKSEAPSQKNKQPASHIDTSGNTAYFNICHSPDSIANSHAPHISSSKQTKSEHWPKDFADQREELVSDDTELSTLGVNGLVCLKFHFA